MGFDDAQLLFENATSPGDAFFPGQTVQGRLVFRQNKVKTFRGFYVKLRGKCDVHWTSRHSRTVDGRTEHYTKNHDSHEDYVNTKLYLMGSPNGEVQLNPGEHVFPFQLALPPHCPSSYESGNGQIRYYLKFVIDRAFKFDQERKYHITVLGRRDLNADPYCKEPIKMDFEESYCNCCLSSGIFELQARVQASGFCPGQTLRCEVKCGNKSNVQINHVKFEIIERRRYIATMHPDTRNAKTIIAKIKKGPIPGGTSRSWTVELEVPEMEIHNLDACNYININYEFEVTIEPSGCHTSTDDSRRILIGNIPLREFDDDIPTTNQTAQLTGPIAHYPEQAQPNSAYTGANPSYPGANTPYSGVNSPYPGANSPYPGVNSSYPGANPPYPGANPPYPGANSPYPSTNLPFNDPSPPYPGQTVSGQQPPPYPGSERHFPSSPGFIMPPPVENKDGAKVPLLPGPGAPYPPMPAAAASPYTKASAPLPSTPHAEIEAPAPPFNPDYVDKDIRDPEQ